MGIWEIQLSTVIFELKIFFLLITEEKEDTFMDKTALISQTPYPDSYAKVFI